MAESAIKPSKSLVHTGAFFTTRYEDSFVNFYFPHFPIKIDFSSKKNNKKTTVFFLRSYFFDKAEKDR